MVVAVCKVTLYIPASNSLKDKRQVLKSVIDRIRAAGGFSVSEVGFQNLWQRAAIGIVTVGPDGDVLEKSLNRLLNQLEEDVRFEILGVDREMEWYFDGYDQ